MPPTINASFNESMQSQLPFVELLLGLGYEYLSVEECLKQRGGDTSRFLLRDIAFDSLSRINWYEGDDGARYEFEPGQVMQAIDDLENIQFEGLIDTSQNIYRTIMPTEGGRTFEVVMNGRRVSKNFRFFDFENPENNRFHVTVEYVATGRKEIRVDIVVFVNGIPYAMIENKKSSVDLTEAMAQLVRNQGVEYCPDAFVYPQLLVATNGAELRYGTTGTPEKFYASWRERGGEEALEDRVISTMRTPIEPAVYAQLVRDLNGAPSRHTQVLERTITYQDRSVVALFEKSRLLDLTKNFIVYDGGFKKIMRYQQYFAIKNSLERVKDWEDGLNGVHRRKGGLLWHTQGSGKSLTMVMLVKAIIEDPGIRNPRIIIVTDRKDLDKQITGTFKNCNVKKEVKQVKTGKDLLQLIKEKDSHVLTTLVHKFQSSKADRDFVDEDPNIFVLIDEAHRTQGGEANLEMNKTIPNACFIGYTGTPLLKKDKESWKKFGWYIGSPYTIQEGLKDKVILPLIYEGRFVDLEMNQEQIDRRVGRMLEGLDEEKKQEIQRKLEKKVIEDNPGRIAEIAFDIEKHYVSRFQGSGLKGQIVAPSKFSAVLFQRAFEQSGKVRTALVVSDENGIVPEDDVHRKEVVGYLDKVKANFSSLKSYEDSVIESFKYNDDGVEIIIVVDKLLTGFDAPRNTILYMAKELRDHNLLQAIARVNRLYDNPSLPKTAGYIVDYSENAKNLDDAMAKFSNFDPEDVAGTMISVKDRIADLESAYGQVHDLLRGVKNWEDSEELIQFFDTSDQEVSEQKRKEFYEAVNDFFRIFAECMNLKEFPHSFDNLELYQREAKQLQRLKRNVAVRYDDTIDYSSYKRQLMVILDKYVDAREVEILTEEIDITDTSRFDKVVEDIGSKESQAEAIASQTERVINERKQSDPEFYDKFSKKIQEILEQMRQKKLSDVAALKEMKKLRDIVMEKKDDSVPSQVREKSGADILYRNLEGNLDKLGVKEDMKIEIVMEIHEIISEHAVVDWWKNPEMKRRMANFIDDYLYDVVHGEKGIYITSDVMQEIIQQVLTLAEKNYYQFS
jgi:type I restriction enzyme R subunit